MKDLRKKLNKKGFTLIELIVVIAILAALAAIALPTMTGLIEKSKKQVAESNARSVYSSASGFVAACDYKITGTITDSTPNPNESGKKFSDFIGSGMTGSYQALVNEADGMVKQADWTDGSYTASYKVDGGKAYIASAKDGSLGGATEWREIGSAATAS